MALKKNNRPDKKQITESYPSLKVDLDKNIDNDVEKYYILTTTIHRTLKVQLDAYYKKSSQYEIDELFSALK